MQRLFIATEPCCDRDFSHANIRVSSSREATVPQAAQLLALFPADAGPVATAGRIYVADPLGNLMMAASARQQPETPARGSEALAQAVTDRLKVLMAPNARTRWFRRIALIAAVLAFGVVVLGAYVRLSDAGLGCPDWPTCYGHWTAGGAAQEREAVGPRSRTTQSRYALPSARWCIATSRAGSACSSRRLRFIAVVNRRSRSLPVALPVFLFAFVILQGIFGALTVTWQLQPIIVTAHLIGGLTTLGLLGWLVMRPEVRTPASSERGLWGWALVGLGTLGLQLALGGWVSSNYAAVACPDFPTCQNQWLPPMDLADAFVLWHRLGVDYTGRRSRSSRAGRHPFCASTRRRRHDASCSHRGIRDARARWIAASAARGALDVLAALAAADRHRHQHGAHDLSAVARRRCITPAPRSSCVACGRPAAITQAAEPDLSRRRAALLTRTRDNLPAPMSAVKPIRKRDRCRRIAVVASHARAGAITSS